MKFHCNRFGTISGALIATLLAGSLVTKRASGQDLVIAVPMPQGPTRRIILHLPPNASMQRVPAVLVFHGGGGDAEAFRSLTNMNQTADARGFAAVYMDAGDGTWGDYRPDRGLPDEDIAYVNAVIDLLVSNYNVDSSRVYATGLSNGGSFSFVLGAELNDRIAAIAPVANNLSQPFVVQATPGGPMHVLQIVGTADPINPFAGGVQMGDVVLSSDATMQYWRNVNGNGAAISVALPDTANDGTTSVRDTFGDSPSGFELARISVTNGGHTWPGGTQYLPVLVIGRTSRDFSANDVIWEFFADKALAASAPCSIDFNNNGVFPEDQDVIAFFDVLAGASCAACDTIDFNGDGVFPSDQDVVDFFNVLAGGSC